MTDPAEPVLGIDVILHDLAALGTRSGFELAQWVRAHRPELEVRLAGSLDGISRTAADLCQTGPRLGRPYEPEAVVYRIRQLRAVRHRTRGWAMRFVRAVNQVYVLRSFSGRDGRMGVNRDVTAGDARVG